MYIFSLFYIEIICTFVAKNMKHSSEYNYKVCDIVLDTLDNIYGGSVSFEQVNKASDKIYLPDHDEVYSFLVDEGLLKETQYGFEITHKGRIVIHKGGLYRQARRECMMRLCTIVAAVSGVIAAIASVISIFL